MSIFLGRAGDPERTEEKFYVPRTSLMTDSLQAVLTGPQPVTAPRQ